MKLGQALFIDQPLATHVWSNCNDGPGDITPIVCIMFISLRKQPGNPASSLCLSRLVQQWNSTR